jgi:glycerol uptake facilitator-like aquaporin
VTKPLLRLLVAELIGTFALVFAGCGAKWWPNASSTGLPTTGTRGAAHGQLRALAARRSQRAEDRGTF